MTGRSKCVLIDLTQRERGEREVRKLAAVILEFSHGVFLKSKLFF